MDKNYKNIDDLLRDTLNDFEKKPSQGVWKAISSTLPGNNILSILSSKILWSVLGLLAIVTMILIFSYDFNSSNPELNISEQQNPLINNDQIIKPEVESNESILPESEIGETGFVTENEKIIEDSEIITVNKIVEPEGNVIVESSPVLNQPQQQINKTPEENTRVSKLTQETYLLSGYYPFLMKMTFTEQVVPDNSIMCKPDFIKHRNSTLAYHLPVVSPASQDDYGKKGNLLYGINIVPELIFPASEKINKGLGIELTGRYLMNDFYLETGLGFSVSEDDGKFTIDYEQFDSIGYYYKVNSFAIDDITGQPVFNTDIAAVFDTVDYNTSEVTRNSYTYLYLPLYAGVKFYEFKKLRLNLQAGIIYSVLISQSEPDASYTNDNATSITIINENPSRIISNWIVSGSLGLQYQINNRIGLNIEPLVKYYVKPVYEQRYDPKATFGAGLRIGMYIKF